MKKRIFIILLIITSLALFAEKQPRIRNTNPFGISAVNSDIFGASFANPAALGKNNDAGFTFLKEFNDEFKDQNNYYLNFSSEGFGYTYHKLDYQGVKFDNHDLAFGGNLGKDFYFGYSWNWMNSDFSEGNLTTSILWYPTQYLALGAMAYDSFSGNEDYVYSAGIRPFASSNEWGNRVTLTADFEHYKDGDSYEFADPILGIQTELTNGLNLSANYDVADETIGINFGLNLGNSSLGMISNQRDDSDTNNGYYYYKTSAKALRTFSIFENKDNFYRLNLGSKIVDQKSGFKIGPLKVITDGGKTLTSIIKEIEKVKNDDRIKGIFISTGNTKTSFANFVELKDALLDLKKSGKKIVFYFDSIGNINYAFAASVADKIYLNPMGSVDLQGISMNQPYFKGLLDKIGVNVENFRSHKYKTAGNSFSEEHMTEGEREALDYLLEGLYQEMITMIESGRGNLLAKSGKETIDNGPYFSGKSALEAGLVDQLVYRDEVPMILVKEFKNKKTLNNFPMDKVAYDWKTPKEKKIALIYATGGIHMGKGKPGKSIGSVTTSNLIRKARKDPHVKGIIIRVNSGGGSALASDIIAREVKLCKEAGKPVVISMGGAAASGGYYISSFADKIVAQPTTITGSIGVVGMVPNFSGLYEKISVNWDTIKKGKFSDLGNSARPMTEDEKHKIHESIENVYWSFIDVVAEGRSMDREEVHPIAQGRVWTGLQAKDRGLVDEIGGLNTAKIEMQKLLKTNVNLKLVNYNKSNDHSLEISLEGSPLSFAFNSTLLKNESLKALLTEYEKLEQASEEKILLIPSVMLPSEMK